MTDILKTIEPKSDQLNADDLIGGRTITIKIVDVTIEPGEQPVLLHFEGDSGKPYKPGKSMRRVIVNAWGTDTKSWIGRRMTLYRDDKVIFGGVQVGGIRISAMSDIKQNITMALTATRSSRKPYTVEPLPDDRGAPAMVETPSPPAPARDKPGAFTVKEPVPEPAIESVGDLFGLIEQGNEAAAGGMLKAFWASLTQAQRKAIGAAQLEMWKKIAEESKNT